MSEKFPINENKENISEKINLEDLSFAKLREAVVLARHTFREYEENGTIYFEDIDGNKTHVEEIDAGLSQGKFTIKNLSNINRLDITQQLPVFDTVEAAINAIRNRLVEKEFRLIKE